MHCTGLGKFLLLRKWLGVSREVAVRISARAVTSSECSFGKSSLPSSLTRQGVSLRAHHGSWLPASERVRERGSTPDASPCLSATMSQKRCPIACAIIYLLVSHQYISPHSGGEDDAGVCPPGGGLMQAI